MLAWLWKFFKPLVDNKIAIALISIILTTVIVGGSLYLSFHGQIKSQTATINGLSKTIKQLEISNSQTKEALNTSNATLSKVLEYQDILIQTSVRQGQLQQKYLDRINSIANNALEYENLTDESLLVINAQLNCMNERINEDGVCKNGIFQT